MHFFTHQSLKESRCFFSQFRIVSLSRSVNSGRFFLVFASQSLQIHRCPSYGGSNGPYHSALSVLSSSLISLSQSEPQEATIGNPMVSQTHTTFVLISLRLNQ